MSNITKQVSQNALHQNRQKRMGPAPFASFEDLSDELESPEDRNASVVRLPGIREDATPSSPSFQKENENETFCLSGISLIGASHKIETSILPQEEKQSVSAANTSLQTPAPPRIDVSRASSSSQHEDSKESTPERELFEGTEQKGTKLGTCFKEEGTLDLRSSTEELDYHDSSEKTKMHFRPHSPLAPNDSQSHQRKDSQSSDIGLLSISGRTSRLSSIGSQCSAQSRISNTSHLSVISGVSGRSSSPHKMLLETSFCGNKKQENIKDGEDKHQDNNKDVDELEKMLLSRKHDPTKAIFAEGINMEKRKEDSPRKHKEEKKVNPEISVVISNDEENESNNDSTTLKPPKKIVSASGIEYIYIPLKGPLPEDYSVQTKSKLKHREVSSATVTRSNIIKNNLDIKKTKSASTSPTSQRSNLNEISSYSSKKEEPKYIRIKLKPDHMYDENGMKTNPSAIRSDNDFKKSVRLDFNETTISTKPTTIVSASVHADAKVEIINCSKSYTNSTPLSSPGIARHSNLGSKSPSPSLSRKSSFSLLFKTKDSSVSPDSPTGINLKKKNSKSCLFKGSPESTKERRRSRSREKQGSSSTAPSSMESLDLKSKQKSVISLLKSIKPSKTKSSSSSPETSTKSDNINNVSSTPKLYHEAPLQGESVRIPLHSPTDSDQKTVVNEPLETKKSSSIEPINVEVENPITPNMEQNRISTKVDKRQSSTSSDNVIFSTKLGSDDEIFTTKLPKDREKLKMSQQVLSNIFDSTQMSSDASLNSSQESKVTVVVKAPMNRDASEMKTISDSLSLNSQSSREDVEVVAISFDEVQTVTVQELEKDSDQKKRISRSKETIEEIIDLPSPNSSTSSVINEIGQTNKLIKVKTVKTIITNNRISMISGDEEIYSSESEKDSEIEYLKTKKELEEKIENLEPERRGLVLQQDSYEDDLPYTPTTLPLERSVALPIIPVKQRGCIEVKTCSIDRPRSTTPINLSYLETFREEAFGSINTGQSIQDIEKIKISLPKEMSFISKPNKSPQKPSSAPDFFEHQHRIPNSPHSTGAIPKDNFKEWINFEEIPEKRKHPRRIQTIPSKNNAEDFSVQDNNVVYTYVNPEDCKCECHEISKEKEKKSKASEEESEIGKVQEDEVPLLEEELLLDEDRSLQDNQEKVKQETVIFDRRSVISDSSVDISACVEHNDRNCVENSLRTPFTGDFGINSNRSSVISQEEAEIAENSPKK